MIRYTVKLTKSEVEELMSIINKGSHTSQTFRTINAVYKQYQQTEHFDTTLLSC